MTSELTPIVEDANHYFTVAEFRAIDAAFANATKYPDADVIALRAMIEQAFEDKARCAFLPRSTTETLSGTGTCKLFLKPPKVTAVSAVTVDGTALTAGEIAELVPNDHVLYWESGWPVGYQNVTVAYTHGLTEVPLLIKRAALTLIKSFAPTNTTGLDPRATAVSTGDMMYRITIAGRDGLFGIPEVDAWLEQYSRDQHFIG